MLTCNGCAVITRRIHISNFAALLSSVKHQTTITHLNIPQLSGMPADSKDRVGCRHPLHLSTAALKAKCFARLYVPGVTRKQRHFGEGPSCLQETAGNGWRPWSRLERAGAPASTGEGHGCWRTSRAARGHTRRGRGVAPTCRQAGQKWALGRRQLREEAVASSSP